MKATLKICEMCVKKHAISMLDNPAGHGHYIPLGLANPIYRDQVRDWFIAYIWTQWYRPQEIFNDAGEKRVRKTLTCPALKGGHPERIHYGMFVPDIHDLPEQCFYAVEQLYESEAGKNENPEVKKCEI